MEHSAGPACCGFRHCLSPHLGGPERGKQDEEHHCLSLGGQCRHPIPKWVSVTWSHPESDSQEAKARFIA